MMKNIVTLLFVLIGFSSFSQINFKTGDASLELELNSINSDAKKDLSAFKSSLNVDFSVSIPKVDQLLKIMNPAEAYLALRISSIVKKPIDNVVQSYKINKDKGWGVIAKDLGIKPGSAEFHALKGKSGKGNSSKGNSGKGNSGGKKKH